MDLLAFWDLAVRPWHLAYMGCFFRTVPSDHASSYLLLITHETSSNKL
jgi:hypothetical protein